MSKRKKMLLILHIKMENYNFRFKTHPMYTFMIPLTMVMMPIITVDKNAQCKKKKLSYNFILNLHEVM